MQTGSQKLADLPPGFAPAPSQPQQPVASPAPAEQPANQAVQQTRQESSAGSGPPPGPPPGFAAAFKQQQPTGQGGKPAGSLTKARQPAGGAKTSSGLPSNAGQREVCIPLHALHTAECQSITGDSCNQHLQQLVRCTSWAIMFMQLDLMRPKQYTSSQFFRVCTYACPGFYSQKCNYVQQLPNIVWSDHPDTALL